MREIKFRGISEDKEFIYHTQWTFGSLVYNLDPTKEENEIRDAYIRTPLGFLSELIEIDPETIGQYTGLTDKNGVEVLEGDILKCDGLRIVIQYSGCAFEGRYLGPQKDLWSPIRNNNYLQWVVIGNIHQNPELLKP